MGPRARALALLGEKFLILHQLAGTYHSQSLEQLANMYLHWKPLFAHSKTANALIIPHQKVNAFALKRNDKLKSVSIFEKPLQMRKI